MEGLHPRTRVLAPASSAAPAVALAAVGVLFVLKYGLEASPLAAVLAPAFAVAYLAAITVARRLDGHLPVRVFRWAEVLVVLGAVGLAVLSPATNEVARLPALDVWLDRLAAGLFPYGSPIRPSGFPGLYALAFPFWVTGSLPLLPVLGLVVFLGTLRQVQPRHRWAVLAGLVLLPAVSYELVVHSELFLNMALALASLWAFEWARRRDGYALAGVAVVAGLLLSTRLAVGVVYAAYGAYAFRAAWRRGLVFGGLALAMWVATWLPFALWDGERFAALGPFSIQGLYLPSGAVGAGALAALGLGLRATDLASVVARTGWLLFLLVGLSFGIEVWSEGSAAVLLDGFDLTYFILPVPFLLLTLGRWGSQPAPSGEPSTPPAARPAMAEGPP